MSLPINLGMDGFDPLELHLLMGGDGFEVGSLGKVCGHLLDTLKAFFNAPEGVDEEQDRKKRNRDCGDLDGVHKPPVSRLITIKVKEPVHAPQ